MKKTASSVAQRQWEFADWLRRNPDKALLERFTFMNAYVGSQAAQSQPPLLQTGESFTGAERLAFAMLTTEWEAFAGTPVFVTAPAYDLIKEAASILPPDEVLLDSEVNTKDMVLWFEQPWDYDLITRVRSDDIQSEQWKIEAITIQWVPEMGTKFNDTVGPGLQVVLYGRPTNMDVINDEAYRRATGGLSIIDCIGIRTALAWDAFPHAPWVADLKSWLVAMHRLMGDHIERERVPQARAERRRLMRLGFPEDGYITELRLRKVAYGAFDGDEGSGAPLRFRHRVRGHWRKFYCPSKGLPVGDAEAYRYSYVNDYIRGPKESPTVESTQVITLAQ